LDQDLTGFVDPDPGEHILKMKKMKISYFEELALLSFSIAGHKNLSLNPPRSEIRIQSIWIRNTETTRLHFFKNNATGVNMCLSSFVTIMFENIELMMKNVMKVAGSMNN
jgi:hypothetical protein